MKPMEHNSFFNEAIETINRIQKENPMLHELNWFFETEAARFNRDYLQTRNPDVIVLGDDIPAEILYSVCDRPFYVLGGSLEIEWDKKSNNVWMTGPARTVFEGSADTTALLKD